MPNSLYDFPSPQAVLKFENHYCNYKLCPLNVISVLLGIYGYVQDDGF